MCDSTHGYVVVLRVDEGGEGGFGVELQQRFGDLRSAASARQKLNVYLTDKSYLSGFTLGQIDFAAAHILQGVRVEAEFSNVARWVAHIRSFTAEKAIARGQLV